MSLRAGAVRRALLIAVVGATPAAVAACDAVTGEHVEPPSAEPIRGPLHVSAANPRYFADSTGRIIYLTGSHTWNSLQDTGAQDPPPRFDYDAYLRFVVASGQNFFRLWSWEQAMNSATTPQPYWLRPLPYARTGPGNALDGKPRFDLTRFDDEYFRRLRERVEKAQRAGVYASVMLFDGWSIEEKHPGRRNPWLGHPFNRLNNVNGIDGDPDHDNYGTETHTLALPAVTALQIAYVKKVIDTVGDLDNVLYEISNESPPASAEWQYYMIRSIKAYEARRPKQHPVGMTALFPGGTNDVLRASPAVWISPNSSDGSTADPPAADGGKVILDDTDHLCGICGRADWVWQSFLRGRNPIFMDVYDGAFGLAEPVDPDDRHTRSLRRNLGYARAYAERVQLSRMVPHPELASTRFCLAFPDSDHGEYLAYIPGGLRPSAAGRKVSIDLRATPGRLAVEWFSPRFERVFVGDSIDGGAIRELRSPLAVGDAVVYVRR